MLATEVGSCFINLAIRESDNNVRSIVLEQLSELNKEHPKILEEKVMDVLRVLARFVNFQHFTYYANVVPTLMSVARQSSSHLICFPLVMFLKLSAFS